MIVTFVTPSARHPIGGVTAIYEFANGMCRRGHEVNLIHVPGDGIRSPDELPWARFESGLRHVIAVDLNAGHIPDADFIFSVRASSRCGLPLRFVQHFGLYRAVVEEEIFRTPEPKVCVARWLVDVGIRKGVARHRLVHVPPGLDHNKFRVTRPIDERPPRVSMRLHNHPTKGARDGIEAIARARERVSEMHVVAFGTKPANMPLPDWVTFVESPTQRFLVEEIYNGSRVFLQPALVEGFGLPPIEAMACGAALVTTANGGSEDYASHGETALVCPPQDVATMSDHIVSLFEDDAARCAIAKRGCEFVRQFDWDLSAEKLERFLVRYAEHPENFRH